MKEEAKKKKNMGSKKQIQEREGQRGEPRSPVAAVGPESISVGQ